MPTVLIETVNHAVPMQTVTSPHTDQHALITVYVTASSLHEPISTKIPMRKSSESTKYKS